ncbi:MAG: FapA family protein [Desulfobacteraceae bacterium]|nr:FapA family protein [Desulfobacteraceae bacterium]
MEPISDIPNIATLAYRYGTIKKNELELVNKLYYKRANQSSFNDILLDQEFVTEYQIGLLKLIQDYYIIQKQGVEFGKIAVEKGFAAKQDIEKALLVQKNAFKKLKLKKLIGDILVESKVITLNQRDQILEEQREFEKIKKRTLLGDVLVNKGIISHEQKDIIAVEQKKAVTPFLSNISFAVSDDNMEALALIKKDKSNDQDIDLHKIKNKLEQERIKHGIFSDSIIQCYIDKEYTSFPVARGTFPVRQKIEEIKYFFKKNNIEQEQIKKGNPLAEQEIFGKELKGKDIFGNLIEPDKLRYVPVSFIRCGSGARLSEDNKKVFAKKTGRPSLSVKNRFYIHPKINILEDADLRYGKIEEYADINISGTLSDAYPVTAGNLKATEIRGTTLEAHGNVSVSLGITGAEIRCQGSINAKYIKNSTIKAFGDVIVQHEIIDSKIIISGELKCPGARIIASNISAKNSITIGGSGSRVTEPCTLSAGRDDHILLESENIDAEIEQVKAEFNGLKDQKEESKKKADQIFEKMIQLKRFHDNTEKKKKKLENQISGKKEKDKKTIILLNKLNNKLKISISSLKALNSNKKKIEFQLKRVENRIKKIEPGIEKSIAELERDRTILLNWASGKKGKSEINIKVKASETTIVKGVFSEKILLKDYKKVIVKEINASDKEDNYSLKIYKG